MLLEGSWYKKKNGAKKKGVFVVVFVVGPADVGRMTPGVGW